MKFEDGLNWVEVGCTRASESNGFAIENWAKVGTVPVENDGSSTNGEDNIDNQQHQHGKNHPERTCRSTTLLNLIVKLDHFVA